MVGREAELFGFGNECRIADDLGQGLLQQVDALRRRARRDHHQAAEAGDTGAPVDQAGLRRRELRSLEQGGRFRELLDARSGEHRHDPHAVARPVERGGFLGHHPAVHFAALDGQIHVARALVADDHLALHAERVGHDGGEIGIAIDLARTRPGHRGSAPRHVRHAVVGRFRSEQRNLGLAAYPRQPGKLAHVVVDAGRVIKLRSHQRLAADEQDRQPVGRRVDGAVDRDQSAGAGLVGRQHPGAELLLQMRDQGAHIGVVAAARAAHRIEAHLLALEECRRRFSRGACRRGGEQARAERSQDEASELSSPNHHPLSVSQPWRARAVGRSCYSADEEHKCMQSDPIDPSSTNALDWPQQRRDRSNTARDQFAPISWRKIWR